MNKPQHNRAWLFYFQMNTRILFECSPLREALKKNHFFVTNVKPPLTPSCDKKPPTFFHLNLRISQKFSLRGGLRSGLRPFPLKIVHKK